MRRIIGRTHLTVMLLAVLLVPLGGVASGSPVTSKRAKCQPAALAVYDVSAFGFAGSKCVQDQYGNQYEFTVDAANRYLYGTMHSGQACEASDWHLLGSYVNAGGRLVYELTASNPLGDSDAGCIPAFKIKGVWPHGAWFYPTGYGDQEFRWTSCGAKPTPPASGGARKGAMSYIPGLV
ncbi:hypothetical protein BH20ACT24_BH20ACT24_16220 [soil metagenome]